jgi:bifunctional non-homologous end joining protein LigD
MADRIPFRVKPMLATLAEKPFQDPGWVYEEKYDGVRILAYKEGTRVTLLSRNELDRTQIYGSIAADLRRLPARTLLLDGEVIALDRHAVSRFQLLQEGAAELHYAVFDVLYRDGNDLRHRPLADRRTALEKIARGRGPIFVSRRLAESGLKAYAIAKKKGYEGLVAKDAWSAYVEGRSRYWLKVKVHQEEEFVIVGYTAPQGSRKHFGALLLGAYRGENLIFVGKVGTGFSGKTLANLSRKFHPLIQRAVPVVNPLRERKVTYLKPQLVAQIAFGEWTKDEKLRQPVFLGLRDDKQAKDVTLSQIEPQASPKRN